MKFAIDGDLLAAATGAVARALPRQHAVPALAGIRLRLLGDGLHLGATDLDLSVSTDVDVAGRADGTALVPGKMLVDIAKAMPAGRVNVSHEDGHLEVAGGRTLFRVRCLDVDDWPEPLLPEAAPVEVDAAALCSGLRRVVVAAATDDSRPILTGVHVESEAGALRLVATDSYRLALTDIPGLPLLKEPAIVPARALIELLRLAGTADVVGVATDATSAAFFAGASVLVTRLIEGEFPNYRQLIPTSPASNLTVSGEDLHDALDRVGLVAGAGHVVTLTLRSDEVDLHAATLEVGSAGETLTASYDGPQLRVSFNGVFLRDALTCLGSGKLRLRITDTLRPVVVAGELEGTSYVVMPVRTP